MSIQAIIYDVDGTLAETEDWHRKAFNKAFAESGLDWTWDVALYTKLLGVTGGKERIKYFVSDFLTGWSKPAAFDDFVKSLYALKTRHYGDFVRARRIALRPGIASLIRRAHSAGIAQAVATTTAHENVAALLEAALGSDWARMFGAVGSGDIVPHKKPAPDVYLWVLKELGIAAANCIALEDSEIGLRASLAAGITTFVTLNPYTRGQDFAGAAAVFDDLADVDAFCRLSGLRLPGVSADAG
jgi:HAD superfamily hydrolase (TIGR01509 family)